MRHHLFGWVQCAGIFLDNTEMQNEKETHHAHRAAPKCHFVGGSYCHSASPRTLYEFYPLWFAEPSMFVNRAILLIRVDIP